MGAVYQPLGNVIFVRNVLVLKIDCRQVAGLVKKLTDLLPKLDTIIDKRGHNLNSIEKEVLRHVREMIRHLIPRDDTECSFSVSSTRNKRSVLHFGGNILHSLFGTATDDQVNRIDRKVGSVIAWAKKKGKLISRILKRGNDTEMKVKASVAV